MSYFSVTPWSRLLAGAAMAVLLSACAKHQDAAAPAAADKVASPTLATVNGTAITQAEFDFFVKQLTAGKGPMQLTPEQKGEVLDELISMQVMSQQGVKDGVENEPETAAGLEVTRMRLLADAESKKYLKSREPTDQQLKTEYDSAVAGLDLTEYHARHILVATKEQAEALIKKIKAGAKFEDIAKADSIDKGSKADGGDLKWFSLQRMVKPFADAVKALKKGEMTSEPVQTQFGYHIIQLLDTRTNPPPPFDQVKDQVKNRVIQKDLQSYVEQLKKTAQVEKTPVAAAPAAGLQQPMTVPPAGSAATTPAAAAAPPAPAPAPAGDAPKQP